MIELCDTLSDDSGIEFYEGGTVIISSRDTSNILEDVNYCIRNNVRNIEFVLAEHDVKLKLESKYKFKFDKEGQKPIIEECDMEEEILGSYKKYWICVDNKMDGFFSISVKEKGFDNLDDLESTIKHTTNVIEELSKQLFID